MRTLMTRNVPGKSSCGRARIKVSAFTQGVTVADLLRALLEREFPENRP